MTAFAGILILSRSQANGQVQQEPKPEFIRALTSKTRRTYQVEVTVITDVVARHSYTMKMSCQKPAVEGDATPMQFELDDLTSVFPERTVKKDTFGTIALTGGKTGFLGGIPMQARILPFTLPLLSFWLPDKLQDAGKWEPVSTDPFPGGISFAGNGRVEKGASGTELTLELNMKIEGENPDQSQYRRIRSTTVIDSRTAALVSSQGKFTGIDETIKYTITTK